VSLVAEQAAFLLDMCKLVQKATEMGWTVTGKELQRTIEQQQIYVKTGKSKTMNSNHIRCCAIDLYFFQNGKPVIDSKQLKPLGEFWCSLHPKNEWGGNWGWDVPHFERRP
jgi:hypothetical protein